MLLRASGETSGHPYRLGAIASGADAAASGVPNAEALIAFAEALVGEDERGLARARDDVLEQLGPEGLVDAAAVASNFERMVRIADATGIPLDPAMNLVSAELREELDLERFAASSNTPPLSWAQRALGRGLRPLLPYVLRLAGRRFGREVASEE